MLGNIRSVRCPRCGISAYDTASNLFGLAHLRVSDNECSYFIEGREYFLKCQYVRGSRDGFLCATDSPCPTLKSVLALEWRIIAEEATT
jgi:hypothetical protein